MKFHTNGSAILPNDCVFIPIPFNRGGVVIYCPSWPICSSIFLGELWCRMPIRMKWHCSLFFVGFVLLMYVFKSNFFDETSIVPWLSKIDAPWGRLSTSISWWKTPILDEIEPSWQPLEGTHNPVGTYLIILIGDNHGRSWNLDWTRRKRQQRGTPCAQLGGPTRYHHNL